MAAKGKFRELMKLSKEGVACDQCNLGVAYALGDGTAKNLGKAVKWYRKAAERNDVIAQILLGDCYFLGEGVVADKEEAMKWYRRSADNGNRLAGYKMELAALPKDVQCIGIRLLRWYTYTVVLGIEKARRLYEKEISVGNTPEKPVFRKWLDIAADGTIRIRSEGKPEGTNLIEPAEELGGAEIVKAALEGNAGAQCILELPRIFSVETAEDESEIAQWYQSAAEQGDSCAQYVMGNLYDLGVGVERDSAQAIEWYKKAAIQGNVGAQNILGSSYLLGRGVAKNKEEAMKWYALAAAQGDKNATQMVQRLTGKGE